MEKTTENFDNRGGTYVENPEIKAKNVAMGDIHQTYNSYGEISPSFSELDFDHDEDYPSPVFTDEVYQMLLRKRVLIIKGNNHFDQLSFGRLIAGKVQQKYTNFKALELIQNEENDSLIPEFKKEKKERIIVLNSIHPRHLDHDFKGMLQISEDQKSFYIIATESSKETWEKSSSIINDFWYQIPESDHYSKPELLKWFIKKFNEEIPEFISEDTEIIGESLISETIALKEIVEVIKTPQKLLMFINICGNSNQIFSDKRLHNIIKDLNQSQEEVVIKWFNSLKSDQKIIALTAALFNGLYCNQYFEILNQMIETSFWKQREETLGALDYFNMDFLDSLFRFETTDEGDLILARNPTTRVNLLKTAMHQYPRHIEKALEIFSSIMQRSYSRNDTNWDLHGTIQKRALIRQVFIEATRDIGINALFNIERVYLELAATNHKYIQGIAAKSFAQYRLFDEDELLFGTLNNWLNSSSIKQRMEMFLKDKGNNKIRTIAAIKGTTIRVLAYAADYDRPNKLHAGIVEHLVSFAQDANYEVQNAVSQVIPKIIHHHSSQLQNEIFDVLMPNNNYRESISEGLMKAYSNYPEVLKGVINHWLSICTKEGSEDNRRKKTTKRDNTLIAIVSTLEKIELGIDGFSLQELYSIAEELKKLEKRKVVFYSILKLIAKLQARDYDLAFKNISIMSMPRKHKKEMVRLWFNNFLDERADLEGGEFFINIGDSTFPAWTGMSKRPLTKMEESLFKWVNSKSKVAQGFATLVFLEIAKSFEREEFKQINAYNKEQERRRIQSLVEQRNARERARAQNRTATTGLGLMLRIRIFFYLLFEDKSTKQSLRDIIKIFISETYSKEDLKFVIYKWEKREKGVLSTKLAKWLKRFRSSF